MCGIVCAFTLRAQQSQQSQSRPGGQECPSPASVSQPLAQRGIRTENSGQTEYCRRESQTDMIGRTIQDVEGIAQRSRRYGQQQRKPQPHASGGQSQQQPAEQQIAEKVLCVGVQGQGGDTTPVFAVPQNSAYVQRTGFLPQVRPCLRPGKAFCLKPAPDKALPHQKKQQKKQRPVKVVLQGQGSWQTAQTFFRDRCQFNTRHAFIQSRNKKSGGGTSSVRHPWDAPGIQREFPPGQKARGRMHIRCPAAGRFSIRAVETSVDDAPVFRDASGASGNLDEGSHLAPSGAEQRAARTGKTACKHRGMVNIKKGGA